MVLSDKDIKKAIKAKHLLIRYDETLAYQPSSIDVHLSRHIMFFSRRLAKDAVIDLKKPIDEYMMEETIDNKKGAIIYPQEFVLGVTKEWFQMPNDLIANVEGKSSLGRLGLVIHATAGFVDPGFSGHITLEITNWTNLPIILYENMPIGQIRFSQLLSVPDHLYGEKVLGSKKYKNTYEKHPRPIASQYWRNLAK
jgi:dCTP deaminase